MRIVTKHAGSCVAVATHPEHKFVYTAGADGSVHVLSNDGEVVFSTLREKGGVAAMCLGMDGYRLAFMERAADRVRWRDVQPGAARFPSGRTAALPTGLGGIHLTAVGGDHLFAVGCNYGRLYVGQWGRGQGRTQRVPKAALHKLPEGHTVSCCQYVDPAGLRLAVGVVPPNRRAFWSGYLSVYNGVPETAADTRLHALMDVDVGFAPVCVARTEGRVVYAGLAEGRLMRLDLRGYDPPGPAPVPDVVKIPQAPKVTAIAASACGRFVAVGADYDAYGGVLLYDADLRPLAMFDTTSEPTALAFHQPWLPDDAPVPALFSGHPGGQVMKWYIDRQLTWMRLVDERPAAREPLVGAVADDGPAHARAIDL